VVTMSGKSFLPFVCPVCTGEACEYDLAAVKLNRSFGDKIVLRDFEIKVRRGETFVIIGASGCGKSVFLKHIVGLLQPDSGSLCVFGRDLRALPPAQAEELHRHIGMVFQSSALLASLTVRENVGLALVERGMPAEEVERIVKEKLHLVNLDGTEDLYPAELSGGMRKRVAVARTLAMNPKMILYDEPTTGLDPIMCDDVDNLILDMKRRLKVTSIVVTHDMVTAFRVADRIGMMHGGRLVEIGTPEEIRRSENPIIREFIARNLPTEARTL